MASYKLVWKSSAVRDLRALPKDVIIKILTMAETLIHNPYPVGFKKIQGAHQTYRLRFGDYRLVYEVRGNELVIQVLRVGHRREIYR